MVSGESLTPPEEAMRVLLRSFDASTARLLAETVGVFPPGTLVKISDGAIAVVARPPRSSNNWAQPVVRVLRDASGTVDYVADLSTQTRWVVESLPGTGGVSLLFPRGS